MGQVGYDAFEGWKRLFAAADRLDTNLPMIMTLHAALEVEMDNLLARQVRRPEKLFGLGFGHKVGLIGATWQGEPDKGDFLCDALFRFNELRNSAAHGDEPKRIAEAMAKLRTAHGKIGTLQEGVDEILNIACDITAFMADDFPTIGEVGQAAQVVGEAMAEGLRLLTRLLEGFARPAEQRRALTMPPGRQEGSTGMDAAAEG